VAASPDFCPRGRRQYRLDHDRGKIAFRGDANGNLVAYDPVNGKPLWHTRLGQVSNAVETYMLDGRQYILAASGDSLYAFALNF